ncbi:hypothetical protein QUB80_26085 [Chlorogloeopsis sp. ULAP01]|nr:hypothetical protein [Chlorogloeopsis sp. ULAP01]
MAVISMIAIGGCSQGNGSFDQPTPPISTDPSREDVIQAVRNSVRGKTYTVEVPEQKSVQRTCSPIDVNNDIHAPRNPELARCPRVGATVQTWKTVYVSKTQTCEEPPGAEFGWLVNDIGDDTWRVSQAGSVWIVKKLEGASAGVKDVIRVSGFTFTIEPQQDC